MGSKEETPRTITLGENWFAASNLGLPDCSRYFPSIEGSTLLDQMYQHGWIARGVRSTLVKNENSQFPKRFPKKKIKDL
jgi:hypothetical protein